MLRWVFFPFNTTHILSRFSMAFFTATTKRNRFNSSFSIRFSRSLFLSLSQSGRLSVLLLLFLLPVHLFFVRLLFFCDFFALHSGSCKTMRCNKLCVCVADEMCKYISCKSYNVFFSALPLCNIRIGRDERLRTLLIAVYISSSRSDGSCHVKSFQRQWNAIECLCGSVFFFSSRMAATASSSADDSLFVHNSKNNIPNEKRETK